MSDTVKITREKSIVRLSIHRPQVFNAVNLDVVSALADHLTALAVDDTVKAIILTGDGTAFSSGGDITWAAAYPGGTVAAFHALAGRLHQAVIEIHRMRKPVIAAVNGVAAGAGFALAIACDFRVMARSAFLKLAYTSNGLCMDGGGTFSLPRIVGLARAMEISCFDKPIYPDQALAWGLVTKIVEDGQAAAEAGAIAREMMAGSLHSFGWTKKLLTDSFNNSFEAHLEQEREGLLRCVAHPDGQEGLRAFREKRPPVFTK